MAKKVKTRKVTRSAKTGKFVKKARAEQAPTTTVTETVPIPEREPPDPEPVIEEPDHG